MIFRKIKIIHLPILGKLTWTMLITSLIISLFTAYQGFYEDSGLYSFFLVFFISFTLLFFSFSLRQAFFQALKPKIFWVLFFGLIFRFKWGLFNSVHMNYFGPAMFFHLFDDFKLIHVHGFTYSIFWYPLTWFVNVELHHFFVSHLMLSIFGALLFYIYLRKTLNSNLPAYIGLLAFVFAPQQVSFSASESHLNLIIFYCILIFLVISFRQCQFIRLSLPFILAIAQYIRPETLIIPYIALFVLFIMEYKDNTALKIKLFIPSIIYLILTISPHIMLYKAVITGNVPTMDEVLIYQVLNKINMQSIRSLFYLIKLRPSYIFPGFLILVLWGFFISIRHKALFFSVLPVHLIMFSQLPAYFFKLSNWHQGIYYQQSLDLFFAVYLAVFAKHIMENFNFSFSFKRVTTVTLMIMICINFFYCINTYNRLYDEQIEYVFIRSNQKMIPSNSVLFIPFSESRIMPSAQVTIELFLPICQFYFNEIIGEKKYIKFDSQEKNEYCIEKKNDLPKDAGLYFFRGIMLDDKDFYKICQNNQVETVKEKSFIFKNRMPTLIPDNSTVTIGFYKIIPKEQ